MHPRKASRHAIKNILLGNPQAAPGNPVYPIPAIGPKVYSNRPTPFWRQELDLICVWTPEEESDDKDGDTLFRSCDHIIEVLFKAGDDMDDKADDYAEVIEALLGRSRYLVDPVTGLRTAGKHGLRRTELGLVREDTGAVYASLKLAWRVEYDTEAPVEDTGVGNFDILHTEFEQGGNNIRREAVDHTTNIHQGV